jgi:hypothetical protein
MSVAAWPRLARAALLGQPGDHGRLTGAGDDDQRAARLGPVHLFQQAQRIAVLDAGSSRQPVQQGHRAGGGHCRLVLAEDPHPGRPATVDGALRDRGGHLDGVLERRRVEHRGSGVQDGGDRGLHGVHGLPHDELPGPGGGAPVDPARIIAGDVLPSPVPLR